MTTPPFADMTVRFKCFIATRKSVERIYLTSQQRESNTWATGLLFSSGHNHFRRMQKPMTNNESCGRLKNILLFLFTNKNSETDTFLVFCVKRYFHSCLDGMVRIISIFEFPKQSFSHSCGRARVVETQSEREQLSGTLDNEIKCKISVVFDILNMSNSGCKTFRFLAQKYFLAICICLVISELTVGNTELPTNLYNIFFTTFTTLRPIFTQESRNTTQEQGTYLILACYND